MSDKTQKPPRPFGVTLAIFVSVVFYSIIPLLLIGTILLVEMRFRQAGDSASPFGTRTLSGGNFRGDIADERILFQAVVAVIFLTVAFFAWRGKPGFMRHIFVGAVLALTAATVIFTVLPARSAGISGSSIDNLVQCVEVFWLIARSFVVPLYVIWYMHRAPARAFYRGHYLPEELQSYHRDAMSSSPSG